MKNTKILNEMRAFPALIHVIDYTIRYDKELKSAVSITVYGIFVTKANVTDLNCET